MTIGIYKLSFTGTDKVYIGQSLNIERRFIDHKRKLLQGTHTCKMQGAYSSYGMPAIEIIEECSASSLSTLELDYISKYNSVKAGYNILDNEYPILYGENNGFSSYSNEVYKEILMLLSNKNNSIKYIAEKTGATYEVVKNVASGRCHSWLEDELPDEYNKVQEIQKADNRVYTYIKLSKSYPNLISPEGEMYELDHQTSFAKEHGLSQSSISDLISGRRKSHKGWTVANTETKKYPKVRDPTGTVYVIPIRGATKFAKEHNLTNSSFSDLLNGKLKSHKGWRLV